MKSEQPIMPEKLLKEVEEHTSCFALFYYDFEGRPVLYSYYPQVKDKVAMMGFMGEYLATQPPLFSEDGDFGIDDQEKD